MSGSRLSPFILEKISFGTHGLGSFHVTHETRSYLDVRPQTVLPFLSASDFGYSFGRSVSQSVSQSVGQSVSQSVSQSVGRSASQSVSHLSTDVARLIESIRNLLAQCYNLQQQTVEEFVYSLQRNKIKNGHKKQDDVMIIK